MTEAEFKEMLDDFAAAARQGEWDTARNRILTAYRERAEQLALARAALEAVDFSEANGHCPWCFGDVSETKDHAPDCQRQAALAALEKLTIY